MWIMRAISCAREERPILPKWDHWNDLWFVGFSMHFYDDSMNDKHYVDRVFEWVKNNASQNADVLPEGSVAFESEDDAMMCYMAFR